MNAAPPQPYQAQQPDKILWLEAFRGAAAIWVLLHHTVQSTVSVTPDSGPVYRVFANGDLGVVLFFVLSGFIIAMASERCLAQGQGFKAYLHARLMRIYLPYLPVGLAMLALYLLWPQATSGSPGVLTSLTLLPSQWPPALSVAWTLVHELLFYALYSLIFVSRKWLHGVMAAWVFAMLWVWLGNVELSRAATYLLAPLNLCFVLGVLAFHATRSGVTRQAGFASLAAGLALVASQAAVVDPLQSVAAGGFAFLITAAVSPLLKQIAPGRLLAAMGAASYSIYLVHKPVLGALARALSSVQWSMPPVLLFSALASAGLLSGLLYFHAFERHAMRYMRQSMSRSPTLA